MLMKHSSWDYYLHDNKQGLLIGQLMKHSSVTIITTLWINTCPIPGISLSNASGTEVTILHAQYPIQGSID